MKNSNLWQVFAAIGLAVIAGGCTHAETSLLGIPLLSIYGLIGQLFLNALTLVVVPLVCSSLIIGVAKMGTERTFKYLGIKTFINFLWTTALAILIGYFCLTFLQPGGAKEGALAALNFKEAISVEAIQDQTHQEAFQRIEQLLHHLIPTNIIAAASQSQMLGLIVFCLLFGFFMGKIQPRSAEVLLAFFQGIFEIMMKITQLVMKALPIGVFALVAKVFATTGFESLLPIAEFFLIVLLGLMATCILICLILLKTLSHVSPFGLIRALAPALVTAFSTSSSAATMPILIDCLEKRAQISPRVCTFVIPLATAINMPGTALYICASVFFIVQSYGLSLSFATHAIILLVTLLTSFGVAGVPSASLIAIVAILGMVGLPVEGVAVILTVERLLDMFRTVVNVFINGCCAVFADQPETQESSTFSVAS